jgi:hypothetical protein
MVSSIAAGNYVHGVSSLAMPIGHQKGLRRMLGSQFIRFVGVKAPTCLMSSQVSGAMYIGGGPWQPQSFVKIETL